MDITITRANGKVESIPVETIRNISWEGADEEIPYTDADIFYIFVAPPGYELDIPETPESDEESLFDSYDEVDLLNAAIDDQNVSEVTVSIEELEGDSYELLLDYIDPM